jgi:hypothetical protein
MNMARTKQLSNMHPRSQEHMWLHICRNQAAWALLKPYIHLSSGSLKYMTL